VFLLGPIVIVVLTSFNATVSNAFPPKGFSLRWYGEFFRSDSFTSAFQFSLTLGIAAAVLATAIGFVTAAELAKTPLLYASYPITPASDILHELSKLKNFGVRTLQAEDEIAAIGAAIGGSFGGCIAMTGTSGPGLALKSEALNLAVMAELPLIVLDIQRGGPSTGLPTKTEQADLLQAMFGRNGESPVPIVAPATPSDGFAMAVEAVRIAVKYMTPVLYLIAEAGKFMPYRRNDNLARPWAIPGTPGLEHRIGGLEKEDVTGNVSYDPINHEKMVKLRAAKVAGIAQDIAPLKVQGADHGELLIVGWGSTYGAIATAVEMLQREGASVSAIHLRHLNPFPANLGDILRSFEKVLVPELNLGQLALLLRGKYLVEARSLSKVQGQPFRISEILEGARAQLKRAPREVKHASGDR
jgi:2-oxoglutarate ferredoxin oxidoreductase subunit alpha